ncbi:MAG: hypothetical protein ACRCVW_03850 [Brevinema sp.]
MLIPFHILINVAIFFVFFIVVAVILSVGAARGFKFHSCKAQEGSCCRTESNHTAKKILALIEKDSQKK